jgi:chorismate synthase
VSSNSFGKLFTVTTFGESHGPAIGCVIDGCPPGLALDAAEFAHDLQRRATGKSRHTSARREADEVEILSGVYEGLTTGTPIALLIRNTDQRSKDYANIGQQFRPGHADYSYWHKYGIRDPRGGGRSSARETTMRVAAGVVAKKWLAERFGVTVRGYLSQLGDITPAGFDWSAVEDNPFFWPHAAGARAGGVHGCAAQVRRFGRRAWTWSPTTCRRAGASRSTASSTANWPPR